MMNGDNLESDECIRHTMVHQTQREHHEEGNQEQGNGSQQDEDNQDSRNKMWSVLQVLLIVSAMGLAGYNHYLLTQGDAFGSSEAMLVQSIELNEGDECYQGGTELQAGIDVNKNDILDLDEVSTSSIVCNGLQGSSGSSGLPGTNGISPAPSMAITAQLPIGDEECLQGGVVISTGIDEDFSDALDEEEVVSRHVICNGTNGLPGMNGQQGIEGNSGVNGSSALIERHDAPSYLCAEGFILLFGVDDGRGDDVANDELLGEGERRASLKFCFSPLISERITDIFHGVGNSGTTSCENAGFLPDSHRLIFAATDGVNGCELYMSDGTSDHTELLADINPSGESLPGRDIGFSHIEQSHQDVLMFDADDGLNGRQIWVTNGTPAGTFSLGDAALNPPVPWMDGMILRSTSGDLLWSNGSELISIALHPSWDATVSATLASELSALSAFGSNMLYGDGDNLWFNAEDVNGDDEPYRVNAAGQLLVWNLSPSGGTLVSAWVSQGHDLFAVAQRGTVRQVVHLMDDGTSQWLTNLAPSSGDSYIGENLGIHLLNDTLVFDALLSGTDATLWATNLSSGETYELSTTIFAPGATLGGFVSGDSMMFDCFMGAHGTELCVTDGTVNGTSLITDMTPGVSSSVLVEAVPLNGEWLVLSSGQDASMTHGVSLWSTEGTEMSLQYNPWPGSSNSSLGGTYGPLLLTDTQAFFIAHDGVSGHEWHRFSHGEISDDWMVLNVQ